MGENYGGRIKESLLTAALKQFNIYNKKYFEGKLPTPVIKVVKDLRGPKDVALLGATSRTPEGDFLIELDSSLEDHIRASCLGKQTLLHEMVHMKLWPYKSHKGKKWTAEVDRLAKEGFLREIF